MQRKENHRCVYIGGSVAGMTGFEPAVSTLTGSHVRPLHHIPMWFAGLSGDPSGIRTHDLHLERVTSKAARRWGRRLPLAAPARASQQRGV